jgi:hypothetical protein
MPPIAEIIQPASCISIFNSRNATAFVLAERHNARINAAGSIAEKHSILRMTSELNPLALNELLGSPLDVSIQLAHCISLFHHNQLDSLLMRSGLTPELTGRAHNLETIQVDDEKQANSRSG